MAIRKTEYLNIRLSQELKTQAEFLAASRGLSLTDLIRYLITKEMERKHDR